MAIDQFDVNIRFQATVKIFLRLYTLTGQVYVVMIVITWFKRAWSSSMFKGVVNCQNLRDKGPPECNSAHG